MSALRSTLVSMVTERSASSLIQKCVFGSSAVRTGRNAGRMTAPTNHPPPLARVPSANLFLMRFLAWREVAVQVVAG